MRPLKTGEIRAIAFLGLSMILTILYRAMNSAPPVAVATRETPYLLERRLARTRQAAATAPGKTAILKSIREQLGAREKYVMNFATAPQAQAHLLEILRRVGRQDKVELAGGDFAPPALLSPDYGQVLVTVSFETTIDAYLNFLADLSREPELIAPSEIHINTGNPKTKSVNVRMSVAAVVAKGLVPEKKGFAGPV